MRIIRAYHYNPDCFLLKFNYAMMVDELPDECIFECGVCMCVQGVCVYGLGYVLARLCVCACVHAYVRAVCLFVQYVNVLSLCCSHTVANILANVKKYIRGKFARKWRI